MRFYNMSQEGFFLSLTQFVKKLLALTKYYTENAVNYTYATIAYSGFVFQ